MLLTESITGINGQLVNLFGIDTITGQAMFRVIWAPYEREKRLVDTTDTGIVLLTPEVREVPKYPWIVQKFVLERLVLIPDSSLKELPTQKLSYEPIWVFMDKEGNYLPPAMWACEFIIDALYAAMGKKGLRKYVDAEAENPVEARNQRVDKLVTELFGDESDLLGRTITGEAIAMPQNYKSQHEEN